MSEYDTTLGGEDDDEDSLESDARKKRRKGADDMELIRARYR
jgi:hypothetical protein